MLEQKIEIEQNPEQKIPEKKKKIKYDLEKTLIIKKDKNREISERSYSQGLITLEKQALLKSFRKKFLKLQC